MSRKRWLVLRIVIVIGVMLCILACYNSYRWQKLYEKGIECRRYEIKSLMYFSLAFIDAILIIQIPKNAQAPKPKRYKLKQDNYVDYSNYIKTRVFLYNYELVIENKVAKFYKRIDKKKIYYIVDVKTDELKEETFEDFYYENILLEIEEDYELMKNKGYYLYITMIISVERITPMFYKYVNSENVDERYYKYPVGVSFGSNQIYMAGEDGFKPNYCKKQKKEIKEILEIEDKKKSD